jgi:hypothetical protein
MTRDVDDSKTSSFLWLRFKIRLYKNLYGLLTGINFNAYRRFAKIYFVAATVYPSDNCMRHCCATSGASP